MVFASGLLRAQTRGTKYLGPGKDQVGDGKAAHAQRAFAAGTNPGADDIPDGQPGERTSGLVSVPASRLSPRHSGRLVGGQEIQLRGLSPVHSGPANGADGNEALPGRAGTASTQAFDRRRARRSRVAVALPLQPRAQRDRYQSRWRAVVSPGADADLQFLG